MQDAVAKQVWAVVVVVVVMVVVVVVEVVMVVVVMVVVFSIASARLSVVSHILCPPLYSPPPNHAVAALPTPSPLRPTMTVTAQRQAVAFYIDTAAAGLEPWDDGQAESLQVTFS